METSVPVAEPSSPESSRQETVPQKRPALPWIPWLFCSPSVLILLIMVVVPLAITLILAFNAYDPDLGVKEGTFTLENLYEIITDPWYYEIFWRTLWLCLVVTIGCLIIGLPEAIILNRMRGNWRSIMLVIVLSPLLISVVVRSFGWSLLLADSGLVNRVLGWFGLSPLHMMYREPAVIIALIHVMLPFMIIPIWAMLQKVDPQAEQAALSLSASRWTTFRRILLPQLTPGILSGSLIVFGLSASSFVIPGILGGRKLKVVATVIYDQYLSELNWPMGAAIALILLLSNILIMLAYNRLLEQRYKQMLED